MCEQNKKVKMLTDKKTSLQQKYGMKYEMSIF